MDKTLFKKQLDHVYDRLMDNPILYRGFVYDSLFRIVNNKPLVYTVLIITREKPILYFKQVVFETMFEYYDIIARPLASSKSLPRQKQVLNRS